MSTTNEAAPVAASRPALTPFKVYDGLELANSAPETCPYLVQDLLPEFGLSMWCAKPKVCKSTLLRQLAVCVAEGRDFLGKPTKTGDVLFLSLEGQLGKIQEHLRKLGYTGQRGKLSVVHEHMPRKAEYGLQRLEATLQLRPSVKLLVIDPVDKLLRLTDNDAYGESTLAIENLEQLAKRFSLHLAFAKHSKKRVTEDVGDSPIGSTGFRAGTDTNLFIVKQGTQRIISTEQRWGEALEPTMLLWNPEREEMSLGQTVEEAEEARHERRQRGTLQRIEEEIFYALLAGKQLTTRELLERVTGKHETKLSVLSQMERDRKVVSEQDGKAKRYSLVEIQVEGKVA